MKVISKSVNANNSRITLEFNSGSLLGSASKIADKYGCGFNHNVTTRPVVRSDGEIYFPISFGTISFNKGNHAAALTPFLEIYEKK